jgi:polyisoprenoid-binding protein YceI
MRTQQLFLSAILLSPAIGFLACQDTAQEPVSAQQTPAAALTNVPAASVATGYELQSKESTIQWKATYIVGGGHQGTVQAESGNLAMDGSGKLVGGYFVLDMNSISSTDLTDKREKGSLEKHLKDDDFFSVQKYPKAYFTLTSAAPGIGVNEFTITGKLEVKGISKEISFPATLEKIGDQIRARASFKINRTKWGVNYQSGSVFSNLKDGIISDDLPITLNLAFKKMP